MSAPPPKLLDQLREACRVRHYALTTEDTYHDWCRRFILFHKKRHPNEMGAAEINAFLTHLAVAGQVAASTQNQAFCAILFLYREVLRVDPGRIEGVVRARRPRRLPVVLTKPEGRYVHAECAGREVDASARPAPYCPCSTAPSISPANSDSDSLGQRDPMGFDPQHPAILKAYRKGLIVEASPESSDGCEIAAVGARVIDTDK